MNADNAGTPSHRLADGIASDAAFPDPLQHAIRTAWSTQTAHVASQEGGVRKARKIWTALCERTENLKGRLESQGAHHGSPRATLEELLHTMTTSGEAWTQREALENELRELEDLENQLLLLLTPFVVRYARDRAGGIIESRPAIQAGFEQVAEAAYLCRGLLSLDFATEVLRPVQKAIWAATGCPPEPADHKPLGTTAALERLAMAIDRRSLGRLRGPPPIIPRKAAANPELHRLGATWPIDRYPIPQDLIDTAEVWPADITAHTTVHRRDRPKDQGSPDPNQSEEYPPAHYDKLANLIVLDGIRKGATRITIQAEDPRLLVRYRWRGRDWLAMCPPWRQREDLLAAFRRLFSLKDGYGSIGRWYELPLLDGNPREDRSRKRLWYHVSCLRQGDTPTLILHPAPYDEDLADLGAPSDIEASLATKLDSGGLILLRGPAESGRTSTLHALLRHDTLYSQPTLLLEARTSGKSRHAVRPRLEDAMLATQHASALGFRVVALDGLDTPTVAEKALQLASKGTLVIMTIDQGDLSNSDTKHRLGSLFGPDQSGPLRDAWSISHSLVREPCEACGGETTGTPLHYWRDAEDGVACKACRDLGYRPEVRRVW